jgi:hypothetical protein
MRPAQVKGEPKIYSARSSAGPVEALLMKHSGSRDLAPAFSGRLGHRSDQLILVPWQKNEPLLFRQLYNVREIDVDPLRLAEDQPRL